MTKLNLGPAAADRQAEENAAATSRCKSPMSQQATFASHGYDVFPQTFVRLVGCHQSRTPTCEAT
jgi:hypothetical protein